MPVSELCEKHQIHPTLFYQWQKTFFENGAAAFERERPRSQSLGKEQDKINRLEAKLKDRNEALAELMEEHVRFKKRAWGELKGCWVAHDVRDSIMDFIRYWSGRTQIPALRLVSWAGLSRSKFYHWQDRYGKANQHNGLVPRDLWPEPWEKQAIIEFHHQYPLEGYRRLTFMMLDRDFVAVSPASTYQVLRQAGLLQGWNAKPSSKGAGFVQPLEPHEHWHVDISYLNVVGTFFYLCSILDGCSRAVLHWQLRYSMTEAEVEIVIQAALEKYPSIRARIITDNGPQFIARDFKEFIRIVGLTHVKTSPYHPQSNGKIERWHQTLKADCLRPGCPLSLQEAQRLVERFVAHYNNVRLHSAIGYITPADRLAARHLEIFAVRDKKLDAARQNRKLKRQRQQLTQQQLP